MTDYRFTGLTPRFYPDERGDDGRSLMAMPGDVHDWSRTPDDGLWVLAGEAPEPVQEAPETPAVPVNPPADPEPIPAPVAPDEPVPAPEPDPAPANEPGPPQAVLDWYAALSQTPPARA